MHAANYKATVQANELQRQTVKMLRVTWDETTPPPIAGQFYMLRAWNANEAPILSRPISVHMFKNNEIFFLYEIKGTGTEKIAALKKGDTLELTGPLGNGFPLKDNKVALVGGGIGTAPLLELARALKANGATVDFYAGYRDKPFRLRAFEDVCKTVNVATDTGNYGHHGFVTDLFAPEEYDTVYTCGPDVMMEKVATMCREKNVLVYLSKESKMACGLGACLGCTCETKDGDPVTICKDGPVFEGSLLYG